MPERGGRVERTMVMGYSTSRSPWDFLNPSNWVINKPLEQNIQELSTGMQIIGTTFPEQLAWKAIPKVTPWAVPAATTAAGAAGAAGATGGTTGLLTGATAAGALGLATTGLKIGAGLTLLQWLEKYWYIPAIFGGMYLLSKVVK